MDCVPVPGRLDRRHAWDRSLPECHTSGRASGRQRLARKHARIATLVSVCEIAPSQRTRITLIILVTPDGKDA